MHYDPLAQPEPEVEFDQRVQWQPPLPSPSSIDGGVQSRAFHSPMIRKLLLDSRVRAYMHGARQADKSSDEHERRRAFYDVLLRDGELLFESELGTNPYLEPHIALYRLPDAAAQGE